METSKKWELGHTPSLSGNTVQPSAETGLVDQCDGSGLLKENSVNQWL